MTLRELIKENPDGLDLPIAILQRDGNYDYAVDAFETPDYDEEGEFQALVLRGNE
jgi:hypothetical protein